MLSISCCTSILPCHAAAVQSPGKAAENEAGCAWHRKKNRTGISKYLRLSVCYFLHKYANNCIEFYMPAFFQFIIQISKCLCQPAILAASVLMIVFFPETRRHFFWICQFWNIYYKIWACHFPLVKLLLFQFPAF